MPKGPEAFRTISEAAEEVGVAPHVLRFWETRFSIIRPMKRAGGRRFYRPQDVALLKTLRVLLHDQGLSIRDVQQLARKEGVRALGGLAGEGAPGPERRPEALQRAVPAMESPADRDPGRAAPAPSHPEAVTEGRLRLAAAREDLLAVKRRLDALLAS